jgi:hypothetical protein
MSPVDQHDSYLGDGVYASFDGFQIWLAVNRPDNKQVALEPQVLQALMTYVSRVYGIEITVTKEASHD